MQAIQLVDGVVKFPVGKVFDGQYGQRVNVVVNLGDGSEVKLWSNPDDYELNQLKKGQKIQLIWDGKKYKLVGSSPVSNPQSPLPVTQSPIPNPQPSELTPDQKRAIATYVQQQADLFNFALKTVRERVEGIESEESARTIATSIYIAAQRKFNL